MRKLTFSLVVMFSMSGAAQNVIELQCGTLIDGRNDQVRQQVEVRVTGERITEVRDGFSATPGATTIDLRQFTCLPGLIDVHTHVVIAGALNEPDYQKQLLQQSVPYRAIVGTQNAYRALQWGFTTLRDVGVETAAGYPDVDVKRAINDGVVPGPRMQVATRAIGVIGAYPMRTYAPEINGPKNIQLVDGADQARKAVREQIAFGADWIKAYSDRGPLTLHNGMIDDIPTLTPEEFHAITDEAHRERKRVASHASALQGVHNAVEAGVDSIEHGLYIADADLKTMAAKGIYYVPTLYVMELAATTRSGDWPEMLKIHQHTVRRAMQAGVKIAFGTDAGGFEWTINPAKEFESMVAAGMTPQQAVRAATVNAAELLGMEDQIGSIVAGKLADIVTVPGNPLQDVSVLEKVNFVMKGGVIYRKP
jgi:imidazolonepropionase-like amidohydrolase